jgi:tRNA(Ile)-lysidine synthetase-like protein
MLHARVEEFFTHLFSSSEWNVGERPKVIVAAVSGGVDSMALLSLLLELRGKLGFSVSVAHVDHALREASAGDAEFVRSFCEERSIACSVRKLDRVPTGENVEDWCRRQRYKFFAELVEEKQAFAVCTAHHANDVLETFLMRLLANKELRGIGAFDVSRRLVRPLLGVRRSELEAFVAEKGLSYVQDETNSQTMFVRNRVRSLLVPFISEHFGASSVEGLICRAQALARDEDLFSKLSEERLQAVGASPFGTKEWVKALRGVIEQSPAELSWRLIERAFLGVVPYRIGRLKALELVEVICHRQVAAQLPGGVEVRRSEGALTVKGQ